METTATNTSEKADFKEIIFSIIAVFIASSLFWLLMSYLWHNPSFLSPYTSAQYQQILDNKDFCMTNKIGDLKKADIPAKCLTYYQ
jgi:hypothetical protein